MKYDLESFKVLCEEKRNDMEEYEVLGPFLGTQKKCKFLHKKCNQVFDMKASNFYSNGYKCTKCRNGIPKNTEGYKKFVEKITNEEYSLIGEYKNTNIKILLYHMKCNNKYYARPNDFENGHRCPYCSGNKKLSFQDMKNKISEIDSDYKVTNLESEINNVHDNNLLIEHLKCKKEFNMNFNNFRNGQRCPYCKNISSSKASKEIIKYLKDNNIKFEIEKTFNDLFNKRKLRFDFYIKDFNILIEYDGKQHFEYSQKGYFNYDKFLIIKSNDEKKNEYCKTNSIPLYRINYKQDHLKELKRIIELASTTIEK